MKLKRMTQSFIKVAQIPKNISYPIEPSCSFKPTFYLGNSLLQLAYNLAERKINYSIDRDKLFFEDGGHISLDWKNQNPSSNFNSQTPIVFIMHGLTGGSETNYIRALMQCAETEGFRSVCMNSRGINNNMTSPIPFTGIQYHQLNTALDYIEDLYPFAPIYMIGASFGGNYLIRYLLNHSRKSINGLVALAPPLNISKSINQMPAIYQKFFVKRYINDTILRHPGMIYWQQVGLVDMKKLIKAQSLHEFHTIFTANISGLSGAQQLFESYLIKNTDMNSINVPTLMMVSKDDPIVTYKNYQIQQIRGNKNIELITTQKGGHLCWFEGVFPKRWYPKPTFEFLKKINKSRNLL